MDEFLSKMQDIYFTSIFISDKMIRSFQVHIPKKPDSTSVNQLDIYSFASL